VLIIGADVRGLSERDIESLLEEALEPGPGRLTAGLPDAGVQPQVADQPL